MATENGSCTGKVAFVTGAANGIGRAAGLAFARKGASVVVADVSEQGNRETAHMIEEAGGRALAVRCDVSRAEDVKAALDRTIETFGSLDVAFNNAGVEQPIKATADLTEEEWDRIIGIDLRGVFLCMKYEIPLMLKQGGGAIVNTSSGAGVKGFAGQAAYCAAKFGVVGPDQGDGPRLREGEHPRKRRVPGDHRNADDGPVQRRHTRGAGEGDRAGAGRTNGEARGDRRGRRLAVFGRGRVRHRARHGYRWRANRVVARQHLVGFRVSRGSTEERQHHVRRRAVANRMRGNDDGLLFRQTSRARYRSRLGHGASPIYSPGNNVRRVLNQRCA